MRPGYCWYLVCSSSNLSNIGIDAVDALLELAAVMQGVRGCEMVDR